MRASEPLATTRAKMLEDPELAALYLEEALAAGDMAAFKVALRNIADARLGGMTALAERAALERTALYRSLSPRGNPTLETLKRIMDALDLRLSVSVREA